MAGFNLTYKFSHVHISTVRQNGSAVGVGMICRTRQGVKVRKVAYVVENVTPEEAAYGAILAALREAARVRVRGLTVILDNPRLVDELNRRARVAPGLQAQYVQVRCAANALGRVRFELASGAENFASRRLARTALVDRQPVNMEYENALLPLGTSEDLGA